MMAEQMRQNVQEVRRFNRFYTRQIGLLSQGLLKTEFPLTQARILFELAQQEQCTASDLIDELGIDPSYLSRILSSFEKKGLIAKVRSKVDSRKRLLTLTANGRKAFSILNERSSREVEGMLKSLSGEDRHRLLGAMDTIESVLSEKPEADSPFFLRSHKPGDIGWITHRHGAIYAEEYGWDERFEALVADILVRFIQKHDHRKERIWIVERDGEPVGSVMIVDAGEGIAQLRLLLVEPKVRGRGIGKRLIDECIDFSKRKGYRKIRLWTQSNLPEARHLYEKAGFVRVKEEPHRSFGFDLIAETWELEL